MKASEIMHDKNFPHGTFQGRQMGCKGSHCPGKESVGITCEALAIRYAGDLTFRRRIDAGATVAELLAEETSADEVKPEMIVDGAGNAWSHPSLTVADSESPVDEPEDAELKDLLEQVDERPRRGRQPGPIKHGTRYGYDRRGCKSDAGCPGDPVTGLTCRQAARGMTVPPAVEEVAQAAEEPTKVRALADQVHEVVAEIDETVAASVETMSYDEAAVELSGEIAADVAPQVLAAELGRALTGEPTGVRTEGLLSDLADAKAEVEDLRERLADANAKAKHHEREAVSYFAANEKLVGELRQVQADAAALGEQLLQSGLSLDVALTQRPRTVSCSVTITPLAGGGVRVTSQGMDAETAADLASRIFTSTAGVAA